MYHWIVICLHRPFFKPRDRDNKQSISTEKCLSSARQLARLVKLQQQSHGLRFVGPGFHLAALCAGTILTLSALEDHLSNSVEEDSERRSQAQDDLKAMTSALREIGQTWPAADQSADLLDALKLQWAHSARKSAVVPAVVPAVTTVPAQAAASIEGQTLADPSLRQDTSSNKLDPLQEAIALNPLALPDLSNFNTMFPSWDSDQVDLWTANLFSMAAGGANDPFVGLDLLVGHDVATDSGRHDGAFSLHGPVP